MNAQRFLFTAVAAAAAAGCYLSSGDGAGPGSGTTGNPSGGNTGTTGGTTTSTDLPCDVATVLTNCTSCHSNPPVGGAPMPLVSYADLTAKALSDPTKTVAEMCVTRMQSTTAPMPPGGGAAAADVTTIQNWIAAGYPQGSCSGGSSTNYNTPTVCTSGVYNTSMEGSSTMQPGNACISCHAQSGGEAPMFSVGGTVYPTAHEPNNCDGVGSGAATVVIMDQNGNQVFTMTTNSAGNFRSSNTLPKPYRAKVIANGNTREMQATQTTGDCNSCHTETGANGAPGRIMSP